MKDRKSDRAMSSFARFLNQTVRAFRLTLPSFVGSS